MVFNSLIFLAFLAVVLPVYYRLSHRAQNWFLLLASWFFYGWWNVWFLGLLWFTSLFDYFCAHWIERTENPRGRKWLLASSMTVNLAVLGVFKYFIENRIIQ
jgi:D-alanyl-lipoteichoic acid acyltransferase DltB (MBOAT superfamily)